MLTPEPFSSKTDTKHTEYFEPVQEIRRLRRDLADRIELLRLRNREASGGQAEFFTALDKFASEPLANTKLEASQSATHKEDLEKFDHFDNRKTTEPNRTQRTQNFDAEPRRNIDENIRQLERHLNQTNQELAQLRPSVISSVQNPENQQELRQQNELEIPTQQNQSLETLETIVEIQPITMAVAPRQAPDAPDSSEAETNFKQNESKLLTVLEKMNVGLILCGFFGVLLAILYFCRGENGDLQLGTPLAFTGLSLVVVGLVGRLMQEYTNRTDRSEMRRGKLTTVR